MALSDWSQTAASNTTIGGININENCPAGNMNDAIRELMAQMAVWYATVTSIGNGLLSAADAAAARSIITAAMSGANTDITSLQNGCAATTQSANDNSTKIATTAYADAIGAKALGYNQTWQNVAGSRSIGASYTNSTGKPIVVSACCNVSGNNFLYLTCDGVTVDQNYAQVSGTAYTVTAVIPAGSSYSVTNGTSIVSWAELR